MARTAPETHASAIAADSALLIKHLDVLRSLNMLSVDVHETVRRHDVDPPGRARRSGCCTRSVQPDAAFQAPAYSINVGGLLASLRLDTCMCMIQERYGIVAERIYRCVLNKRYIEQKQIAGSPHARAVGLPVLIVPYARRPRHGTV